MPTRRTTKFDFIRRDQSINKSLEDNIIKQYKNIMSILPDTNSIATQVVSGLTDAMSRLTPSSEGNSYAEHGDWHVSVCRVMGCSGWNKK